MQASQGFCLRLHPLFLRCVCVCLCVCVCVTEGGVCVCITAVCVLRLCVYYVTRTHTAVIHTRTQVEGRGYLLLRMTSYILCHIIIIHTMSHHHTHYDILAAAHDEADHEADDEAHQLSPA